jgi:hypothetical protein
MDFENLNLPQPTELSKEPKQKKGCFWWIGFILCMFALVYIVPPFLAGLFGGSGRTSEDKYPGYYDTSPSTSKTSNAPIVEKRMDYLVSTDVERGVTSLGDVWYDVLVIVENIGEADIYLDGGSLEIEDSSGVLIQKEDLGTPAPRVITTGQKGVYKEAFTIDKGDPEQEYDIIANVSVKKAITKHQYMTVSDMSLLESDSLLHEEGYSFKIVGRVSNFRPEKDNIYIYAFLYDDQGNILHVLHTSEMVDANSKAAFEMNQNTWYREIKYDDIANYKVVAYPYLYQFD